VVLRLDMGALYDIGAAGIDDDQFRPLTQTLFQTAGKDGMAIGGVRANEDDNIGMFDGIEILGACRCAKGLTQTIARG